MNTGFWLGALRLTNFRLGNIDLGNSWFIDFFLNNFLLTGRHLDFFNVGKTFFCRFYIGPNNSPQGIPNHMQGIQFLFQTVLVYRTTLPGITALYFANARIKIANFLAYRTIAHYRRRRTKEIDHLLPNGTIIRICGNR